MTQINNIQQARHQTERPTGLPSHTPLLVFSRRIMVICTVSAVSLLLALTPSDSNSVQRFKEFFRQELSSKQQQTLLEHRSTIESIIAERTTLLWGADYAMYFNELGDDEFTSLYYSDSLLIRRQSCWLTSEFAKDIDYIDISLYTTDNKYSLREMYAINRDNGAWTVVDSTGYPLFERVVGVSSETTATDSDLKRFLVTLLSYADYGSHHILNSVDTVYHEIVLKDTIDEYFYPFSREIRGDTTEIIFTTCLIDGVEITRWSLLWSSGGIEVQESELLIDYTAMPIVEDTIALAGESLGDSTALTGLLSDVTGAGNIPLDSMSGPTIPGRGVPQRVLDRLSGGNSPGQTPPNPSDLANDPAPRLVDLISGRAPQLASGHVSYEILSGSPLVKNDAAIVESIPEFINFAEPIYPPLAIEQSAETVLELKVRIDTLGQARQVLLMKKSGTSIGFEASAKTAASQSKFKPGVVGGVKADMWLNYRLNFRIALQPPSIPVAPTAPAPYVPPVSDSTISTIADSLLDTLANSPIDTILDSNAVVDSTTTDTLVDSLADSLTDSTMIPDDQDE